MSINDKTASNAEGNTAHGVTRRTLLQGAVMFSGAAALGLPFFDTAYAAADPIDMAAAKAEGKVSLYTSAPIRAAQKIASEFEKAYGIKVEVFRTGGTEVLRRFMMEQQGGHKGADVLVSSDPGAVIGLADKNNFVPFAPLDADKVRSGMNDPKNRFIAQRISVITNYGRADLFPEDKMPKTWADLVKPEYKGKLVMTDPAFSSLQLSVVAMLARDLGWKYYEDLRKNDIIIVKGNEIALAMVKSGERPIAAGADSQYANQAREAGHKIISSLPSDGTFAIPSITGIVKDCAHPQSARLLSQYMMGLEAQKLLPEEGVYSARIDVDPPAGAPPIKDVKLREMDYLYVEKNATMVKNKFNEIFS
jgi:iron(III) transport system substrate-binding protein